MEVGAQVQRYSVAALSYLSFTLAVAKRHDEGDELPAPLQEERDELADSLLMALKDAAVARSKLLLLRDQDSTDRLEDIIGAVTKIRELKSDVSGKVAAAEEEMVQLADRLVEAEAAFYASLSKRYN